MWVKGKGMMEGDDATCITKRREKCRANPSQLNTGIMAGHKHRTEKIQTEGFYCLTVVKLPQWQRAGS